MTDLTVAKTILEQIKTIDPMALMSWGAKGYVGSSNSIQFSVGGMTRWKGKVVITLNERDLYDIRFFRGRGIDIIEDTSAEDVYVEDLVDVIDGKVG